MNKTTLATEEDIKLIRIVLAELNRQVKEDASAFYYDTREVRNELEFDEEDEARSTKTFIKWIIVTFQPSNSVNNNFKDVERVQISFCYHSGQLSIELTYNQPSTAGRRGFSEQHEQDFFLGNNKDLNGLYAKTKMDFIRLYKAVKVYHDDFLPRKNRERFETAIYNTFPSLLDDIIMEDDSDKKES